MHCQSTASGEPETLEEIETICRQFKSSLRDDPEASIEQFLNGVPLPMRSALLLRLIVTDMEHRESWGEIPSAEKYLARFPADAEFLREQLAAWFSTGVWDASSADAVAGVEAAMTVSFVNSARSIDRYHLQQCIGRGGYGEVWSAHDPLLDQTVAIKLLRPDRAISPAAADLLLKEGRRLAHLDHEHIVRILDAGLAEGNVYLVLEHMPGGSLQQRLRRKLAAPDEAARWTIVLARALHHAHRCGFVHRDIKPSNILFDAEGRPHLADFGLAISEEELLEEIPATVGTYAFMSPEQARGESHLADPRSDVYSLGVVLYHALTGRLPFPRSTPTKYQEQLLTREPHPLRTVDDRIPAGLEAICLKCLNRSISGRFATALELAEELERWQSSLTSPPPPPPAHRRKWVAAAALSAVAVVMAALLLPGRLSPDSPSAVVPGQVAPTAFDHVQSVAWEPYDIHDEYGYDAEQKRFVFDASGRALFQTGPQPDGVFRLQMEYNVSRWNGMAGCFWGLNRSRDGYEHCWAVLAGRTNAEGPARIEISEFVIGPSLGGRMGVNPWTCMKSIPATLPQGERAVLEIEAAKSEIRQVWLNGEPLLDLPFPLPERDWAELRNPRLGFCGHRGRIAVYAFSTD